MAGTYTRTEDTVFGNKKIRFYTVTNYTNAETLTVEGFSKVDIAIPMVNAASASVGISSIATNVITFATAADTYDGVLMVIGR